MRFFITFLEGVLSFISPCMLPLLPLYISYFAGAGESGKSDDGIDIGNIDVNHAVKEENAEDGSALRTLLRALAFVLGFTLIFCLMGAFAGLLGELLARYKTVVNAACGAVIVLFGLSYLEILPFQLFKSKSGYRMTGSLLSAFLFGVVYSVSLSPCVGAFLGSALMLAASEGGAAKGIALLLAYSLGLGVPFVLSAILIGKLKGAFSFLKRHGKTVRVVCGIFLIVVGILVGFGLFSRLLGVLSV